MRKIFLGLILSLLLAANVAAQSGNVSASSYKQGPTTSQNVTSATAGTAVDVTGYSYVQVMYKGTYTTNATNAGFQVSLDSGTTYIDQFFYVMGTTSACLKQAVTGDLTDNSTNVFLVPVAGFNRFRTSALNWASGTIAVTIVPFSSPGAPCSMENWANPLSSSIDSVTAKTDQTTHGTTDLVAADVTKLNGTATDTNSGSKSAGTLRVVIATDQPALSNKLLVTPDSVALPANQSVNVSQINGVTTLMGNGTTGTGSQRVTIASDNTAFTVNPASATAPVSTMNSASANAGVTSPAAAVFDDTSPTAITENSFGFLRMSANRNLYGTIRDAAGNERGANVNSSNQLSVSVDNSNVSTNIAQMNGVAVTMGNGVSGTGVQRVTIASDSTGVVGTTGFFTTVSTTITRPADTTAYAAGDAMSNSTSAPTSGGVTFTSAARTSGGSGIITDAVFTMSTAAGTSLQGELWIFDQAATNINDNTAFSISDGDSDNLVAIIPFTTSSSGTNNASAHVTGLNIGFTCVGSANLRGLVKVINAYTPASSEVLKMRLKILQVN